MLGSNESKTNKVSWVLWFKKQAQAIHQFKQIIKCYSCNIGFSSEQFMPGQIPTIKTIIFQFYTVAAQIHTQTATNVILQVWSLLRAKKLSLSTLITYRFLMSHVWKALLYIWVSAPNMIFVPK